MKSFAVLLIVLAAAFVYFERDRLLDDNSVASPASVAATSATEDSSTEAAALPAAEQQASDPQAAQQPVNPQAVAQTKSTVTQPAPAPQAQPEIPQSPRKLDLARAADSDLQAAGCTFRSRKIEGSDSATIENELSCAKDGNPDYQRAALSKYISDISTALREAAPDEDNSEIYNKSASAGDALATMVMASLPPDAKDASDLASDEE